MSSLQRTNTGWRVQWIDGHEKRRTHTLRTKDRRAAERFGAKMEDEAAKIRAGLVDADSIQKAEASKQPIIDAVEEWKADQGRKGRTEKHIHETATQIEKLATLAGWERLIEIEEGTLQLALDGIRSHGGKAPKGEVRRASARTIQAYVRAIKGFTRWCIRTERMSRDPLVNVTAPDPQKDRKHVRRAMTKQEWRELQQYLQQHAGTLNGISPEHRSMLYELLIMTGYRKEEFRQLRVSSLQEVAGRHRLVLEPQYTKNGRAAQQALSKNVGDRLQQLLVGMAPDAQLLPMPSSSNVVLMLRADLAAARERWIKRAKGQQRKSRESSDFLTYEDHQGRKLDVHALRHTCGAWLAEAGIQPKVIQQVMRHASITTTFDLYGHLMPGMMEDAIDQLGDALGALG